MPDNTQRFTGRAEDYDHYRQRYSSTEVLSHLRGWCGLSSDWLIADIGAGTGMLAEVFLENSNRVIAVEPNAEMRSACERLYVTWPQLQILDASAEDTTIPATSIDMVAVGRAFHWFDKDRALAEFRRILKPNGWVALVSVGRAHQSYDPLFDHQIASFERLLNTHGTDYNYVRSGYRVHDNMQTLFGGELHQAQIPGTQQLDWPTFRGHAMSLSVSPQSGHPKYEAFQRELRLCFDTYAVGGILTVPTLCYITAARL